MSYLIIVRHGESGWNVDGRFGGWVDVPLTGKGIKEALLCAAELEEIDLDLAFTSKLIRAQETLFLILSKQKKIGVFVHEEAETERGRAESGNEAGKDNKEKRYAYPPKTEKNLIPIHSNEALNERYYGILQGKKKDKMKEKYGEEQILHWCRSFDEGPPEGESLKDIYRRAVPYFEKEIFPTLQDGKNVIVCAHQNSLRALIKHIEGISNEDIRKIRLANARPVIYTYSGGRLVRKNAEMDPAVKRNL
ncbi:Phosphoglycerate mutase [Methanosarcina siciliae HI350]|uniref:2,3-bisphosphoglycerate-dependent phosphoglycerate mutase n=1 Tax=Methanosarcina siciliae HI350 TaxID=1434119 RepID=A0A0E3PDW9_9EURY|nr:2,3-diphosphoglycerate-dependent phosphoglycerate mutase [Methanosarcina siciliae]AKB32768.1 Phosphoglycerate mutase [Methanosarcina siciliae HI350]